MRRNTLSGGFLLAAALAASGAFVWGAVGSGSNNEWNKEHAPAAFEQAGWHVTGYAGYQWGFGGFGTTYGGAKTWFYVRRVPDSGLSYQGYVVRWGDEVHIYGPQQTERSGLINN